MYEPFRASEIIIKFPPHLLPRIKVSPSLPTKFIRYQLPDAKVTYSEGPFGAFMSQAVSRRDWTMGILAFDCHGEETFHPFNNFPFIGIYFSLMGDVFTEVKPDQMLYMRKGHYGMSYLPAGTIGNTKVGPGLHVGLYFSFSDYFLSLLAEAHPALQELVQKHQHGYPKAVQLSRFAIPPTLMDSIEQILDNRYEGAEAMIFAQKNFNDFLLSYIRDLKEAGDAVSELAEIPAKIIEAAQYLETNFNNPKPMPFLARDAGMNISTFEREFKKAKSVRPIEYLTLCRIEEAERLLKTTNKTLETIAGTVGFTDRSHMYKAFMKNRGCGPSAYRNNRSIGDL
jgi:AraC-like DNA-binding protein